MSEKPPRKPVVEQKKSRVPLDRPRRKLSFDASSLENTSENPVANQEVSIPDPFLAEAIPAALERVDPTPEISHINTEESDAVFEDIPLEGSKAEYIDKLGQEEPVQANDAEFEDVISTSRGVALYEAPEAIHAEAIDTNEGNEAITRELVTKRQRKSTRERTLESMNNRISSAEALDVIRLPDESTQLEMEDQSPHARHEKRRSEVMERLRQRVERMAYAESQSKTIEMPDSTEKPPKPEEQERKKKKEWKDMTFLERAGTVGAWTGGILGGPALAVGGALAATYGVVNLLGIGAIAQPVAGAGLFAAGGLIMTALGIGVMEYLATKAFKQFFFNGGFQEWAGDTFGFLGLKGISFGKKGGADHKPAKKAKKAGGHGGHKGGHDDHGHGGGSHGDHGHAANDNHKPAANDNHGHAKDDHGHAAAAHH